MKTIIENPTSDHVGRVLHAFFAVAIVCQLLSSYVMERPYLGRHLRLYQDEAFIIHKTIGLFAIAFVLCYWLWVLTLRRDKLKHLFPWSKEDWPIIIDDIKSLFRLCPPEHKSGGLAGFVHGLGLLLVTAVGICGIYLFIFLPRTHLMPSTVHFVKETHGNLASLIWWYVIGHSILALWHWLIKSKGKTG